MKKNMEQEFDQLLSSLVKKEYPLNKWMEEDETEAFDRIVSKRKHDRSIRRWIAVAACLVILVGIASIAKLSQWNERQEQLPQLVVAKTDPVTPQEVTNQMPHHEEVKETKPALPVGKQRKTAKSAKKTSKQIVHSIESESTKIPTKADEKSDFNESDYYHPRIDDPLASIAREMSEIRQRGEQLSKEVAMFINNN